MAIDPKMFHCNVCGTSWKPKLYHKIIMLCFGSYSRKCNQCGTVMVFRLISHVVRVSSVKVLNERIWENG